MDSYSIQTILKRAQALLDDKKYEEALKKFKSASLICKDKKLLAEINFQTAMCKFNLENYEEAIECLRAALKCLPNAKYMEVQHIYEVLIASYDEICDFESLTATCLKILELRKNEPDKDKIEILKELMQIYSRTELKAEALEMSNRIIACDRTKENLRHRLLILSKNDDYANSLKYINEFVDEFGYDADIYAKLGSLYLLSGNSEKSMDYYKKALDTVTSKTESITEVGIIGVILGQNLYTDTLSDEDYIMYIEKLVEQSAKLEVKRDFKNPLKLFKKIKIGYLSADLRNHPVGIFLAPVIIKHWDTHSHITCYSLAPDRLLYSTVAELFEERADKWVDVKNHTDERLIKTILNDELDILFDMMCHSSGNRLMVHATRPAPIQISWIGFPVTTGVKAIDYVIVDPYTDPINESEQFYSEELLYMPDTFLCYTVKDFFDVELPPFEKNGYITFGCYHNPTKLNSRTLNLWRQILERVPNSKLIIKGHQIDQLFAHEVVEEKLRQAEMPRDRLILLPNTERYDYLKSYNEVDILLDTYPFNGATTTCDAFIMSTPIITLVGDRHVSRVGYSMLRNVGLEDLAAFSDEEYVEKAVALANDHARIRFIKANLRDWMLNSPIYDQHKFRKDYEVLLRDTWINHCLNQERDVNFENDSFTELFEQVSNASHYLKEVFDADCQPNEELMIEFVKVQSIFDSKLSNLVDNEDILRDFRKISKFVANYEELDAKSLIKVLDMNLTCLDKIEAYLGK